MLDVLEEGGHVGRDQLDDLVVVLDADPQPLQVVGVLGQHLLVVRRQLLHVALAAPQAGQGVGPAGGVAGREGGGSAAVGRGATELRRRRVSTDNWGSGDRKSAPTPQDDLLRGTSGSWLSPGRGGPPGSDRTTAGPGA